MREKIMEPLYKQKVVSCSQMKELEKEADTAGLSYYQMMENAGSEAVKIILHQCAGPKNAVIFCGKGNNGGDGFVAARKFLEKGLDTTVVLVEGEPVTEDARANYGMLDDEIRIFSAEDFLSGMGQEQADILVDAVYGTGFHGSLRSPADRIIAYFNEAKGFKAALDLPSGLSGDMENGEKAEMCVKADLTVTFHAKKPVHLCEAAQDFLGIVVTADIGIGQALENGEKQK